MKILVSTSNLVLLANESLVTGDESYKIDGVNCGVPLGDASIVEADGLPDHFYPYTYSYENGVWSIADQELYDTCRNQEISAFNGKQREARSAAYTSESDSMFFKAQRGEATMAEWEAKIEEIKKRYPYMEVLNDTTI